ncbi:MAG: hypothetical protein ACE367_07115 [Acidimicrobiales bacterium]
MERLDTRIGWPTTHMDDEFVMRSVRYLAAAGYRDDAIVAILTSELGAGLTRVMRIVAAAKTDRIAATALQEALAHNDRPEPLDADDGLPPAA